MVRKIRSTRSHLVIVIEVNPATQSLDGLAPFCRVSHNNRPTLLVVFLDSDLLDRLQTRHAQFFVDLISKLCQPNLSYTILSKSCLELN